MDPPLTAVNPPQTTLPPSSSNPSSTPSSSLPSSTPSSSSSSTSTTSSSSSSTSSASSSSSTSSTSTTSSSSSSSTNPNPPGSFVYETFEENYLEGMDLYDESNHVVHGAVAGYDGVVRELLGSHLSRFDDVALEQNQAHNLAHNLPHNLPTLLQLQEMAMANQQGQNLHNLQQMHNPIPGNNLEIPGTEIAKKGKQRAKNYNTKTPSQSKYLNTIFLVNREPSAQQIADISRITGLKQKDVGRWFRDKRFQSKLRSKSAEEDKQNEKGKSKKSSKKQDLPSPPGPDLSNGLSSPIPLDGPPQQIELHSLPDLGPLLGADHNMGAVDAAVTQPPTKKQKVKQFDLNRWLEPFKDLPPERRLQIHKQLIRDHTTTDEKQAIKEMLNPRGPYRGSADENFTIDAQIKRSKDAWLELERRFCSAREKSAQDYLFLNQDMIAGLTQMFSLHHDYLRVVSAELGLIPSEDPISLGIDQFRMPEVKAISGRDGGDLSTYSLQSSRIAGSGGIDQDLSDEHRYNEEPDGIFPGSEHDFDQ